MKMGQKLSGYLENAIESQKRALEIISSEDQPSEWITETKFKIEIGDFYKSKLSNNIFELIDIHYNWPNVMLLESIVDRSKLRIIFQEFEVGFERVDKALTPLGIEYNMLGDEVIRLEY